MHAGTFILAFFSSMAEGGVRSGFHTNCQLPIPLQLNTPFHHHGSREAPFFPGDSREHGRECETARVRERANEFCKYTVIQYGSHCVQGWLNTDVLQSYDG